jgi:hypothetical protein
LISSHSHNTKTYPPHELFDLPLPEISHLNPTQNLRSYPQLKQFFDYFTYGLDDVCSGLMASSDQVFIAAAFLKTYAPQVIFDQVSFQFGKAQMVSYGMAHQPVVFKSLVPQLYLIQEHLAHHSA